MVKKHINNLHVLLRLKFNYYFFSAIIEAYEKALAELVAEKEKLTDNYEVINEKLRHERDIHHQHLMSLETTFSDLHM